MVAIGRVREREGRRREGRRQREVGGETDREREGERESMRLSKSLCVPSVSSDTKQFYIKIKT